jgi:hypothetical protein
MDPKHSRRPEQAGGDWLGVAANHFPQSGAESGPGATTVSAIYNWIGGIFTTALRPFVPACGVALLLACRWYLNLPSLASQILRRSHGTGRAQTSPMPRRETRGL